jgi:hypothetical protein
VDEKGGTEQNRTGELHGGFVWFGFFLWWIRTYVVILFVILGTWTCSGELQSSCETGEDVEWGLNGCLVCLELQSLGQLLVGVEDWQSPLGLEECQPG